MITPEDKYDTTNFIGLLRMVKKNRRAPKNVFRRVIKGFIHFGGLFEEFPKTSEILNLPQ